MLPTWTADVSSIRSFHSKPNGVSPARRWIWTYHPQFCPKWVEQHIPGWRLSLAFIKSFHITCCTVTYYYLLYYSIRKQVFSGPAQLAIGSTVRLIDLMVLAIWSGCRNWYQLPLLGLDLFGICIESIYIIYTLIHTYTYSIVSL